MNTSPIKHILVVRLGSLSSAAMCVHALRGLVRDFPELRVTLLTHSAYEPLFATVTGVEYLFADLPQYRGLAGKLRLWWHIQRLGVDAVADLSATPLSRLLLLSPTPWRRRVAHLDKQRLEGKALTRKFRKVMVQRTPLATRSRDLFASLGLPFCMPAPVRRTSTSGLSHAVEILSGEKQSVWIGVSLLSAHHGTCYPLPLAAKLVELLASRYEKVFVFGEGEYQRQFCEGMQSLHPSVVSVAGKLTLSQQLELLSHLDVVVSIDNSILRLASLVGTPVISLWGATHPYLESSGYGQDPKYAIQCDLPCRPCSTSGRRRCLFGSYECMNSISPEEVFRRVKAITGRRK